MENTLVEILSLLRGAFNMRRPLYRLPTETLVQIVQDVLYPSRSKDRTLESFWLPRIPDSTSLIPVSRSCRRLRNVALSRPEWWTHLSSRNVSSIPTFLSRSNDKPLTMLIESSYVSRRHAIHYTNQLVRLREVHFLSIDHACMEPFNAPLQMTHKSLEKLTLCASDPTNDRWKTHRVYIDSGHFPRLQHLVIHGMAFRVPAQQGIPTLTHLVLSRIHVRLLCHRVTELIAFSPLLENLVLSRLVTEQETELVVVNPPPLLHLRRIYFHDLCFADLRFFLKVTARTAGEAAVQVVNDDVNCSQYNLPLIFKRRMPEGAEALQLSATSSAGSQLHQFAITATNSTHAVRVGTRSDHIYVPRLCEPGIWFEPFLADTRIMSSVRELWLFGAYLNHADWLTYFGVSPKLVFGALPNLQSIVIVTVNSSEQSTLHPPDLYPLPDIVEDPSVDRSQLKKLRLVHCVAPDRQMDDSLIGDEVIEIDTKRLKLSRMLDQLASGGYSYFKELVLQITPDVGLDPVEEERLLEYFETVTIEEIFGPPQMPLPRCCVDEDDGPGGSCTWTAPLY